MSNKIYLSIITPIYNSENYIKCFLDNCCRIEKKIRGRIEFILINDGSEDNSENILKEYLKKYDFIKYITYSKNKGVSFARNLGIKNAQGEYITFVDCDDSFNINSFDKITNSMKRKPDIIYTDYYENKLISITNKNKYKIMKSLYTSDYITCGVNSKIYKRKFIIENDICFPIDVVIGEDAFFAINAIDKAKTLMYIDLKFYIVKESHTLFYFNKKLWISSLNLANCINELFKFNSKNKENIDADNVKEKMIISMVIPLIDRYFGPLYKQRKITLNEINKNLGKVNKLINFSEACKNDLWVKNFNLRYKIFCKMLSKKMFKLIIIFNNFMDNIKKYNRFK